MFFFLSSTFFLYSFIGWFGGFRSLEQYHLTQDDLFPDSAGQGIWCKKTVAKGKKFSVFMLKFDFVFEIGNFLIFLYTV